MASKKSGWAKFPHDQKAFDFSGDKLKKAWPSLHSGDCEPYPDDKRAAALIKAAGKAAPKGLKAEELASRFGSWYYVISAESFEKFKLSRDAVVGPKEEPKPSDGPAIPGAGSIPNFDLPGLGN